MVFGSVPRCFLWKAVDEKPWIVLSFIPGGVIRYTVLEVYDFYNINIRIILFTNENPGGGLLTNQDVPWNVTGILFRSHPLNLSLLE